ncbi:MAG TPA: hypothetical protein VFL92_09520 [Sphingomonas sp.]|nr:hypothetical protein [Sphingomonas sp.]
MQPEDVRAIRAALGLTQDELAEALGFSGPTRRKTIQRAEDDSGAQPLSGPASVALTYLAQGALDETMQRVLPEHVAAVDCEGGDQDLLIRLWRPRFIGVITEGRPAADRDAMEGEAGEWLSVAMWIDDPAAPPGWNVDDLLHRALAAWEIYTQDSFEE